VSIDSPSNEVMTVGKITGCYGIKGWVKIHSYTEPQENFLEFKQWHVQRRGELEPLVFDQGKCHGKGLVAHIKGVDDRTLAESYKGLSVVVPEAQLPGLEDGDYYWRQLQGLAVWCRENGEERVLLGEVDYLIETGANDVLVVKANQESVDDRERLIPYLQGDTILRVDLQEGLIEVDWFLDEE
jgi:16S rRNA processing protein RimM